MKKILFILLSVIVSSVYTLPSYAQAAELQQLALNIEKLAQFRQILADMKKGYTILSGGYSTIKNISRGNFELHKVFLDGLMEVSPNIKKYKPVAGIIHYQIRLVKEYKSAFTGFQQSGWFLPDELNYITNVYSNLVDLSLKNLDDLFTVITSNRLRMSDDERLAAIDRIYADMQDKVLFLRHFNNSTSLLSVQRAKENRDVIGLRQYYQLK